MQQLANTDSWIKKLFFKIIIVLFFVFIQINTIAQKKSHEIGAFVGAAYYNGELNTEKVFYMPSPAIGFLYRHDINSRYAFKITGIFSILKGDDANSINLYQQQRNHKFTTTVIDFAPMIEFNFLSFNAASYTNYYSVYATAGIGAMYMQSPANFPIHPIIPFGLGFKYGISKRIVVTAEWITRKTFTDYIDQLPPDEYSSSGANASKQLSYNNSKDWYSFAGITFTYKFALGSNECPAYGKL